MNRSHRWTEERDEYDRFEPRPNPRHEDEGYELQPYGRRRAHWERHPDYDERGFERGSYAARYGFEGRTGGPDYGRFAPEPTRGARGRGEYDSDYRDRDDARAGRWSDDSRRNLEDFEIRRNLASAGRGGWDSDRYSRERDYGRETERGRWSGPRREYSGRSDSGDISYSTRGGSSDSSFAGEAGWYGGYGSGRASERALRGEHSGKGPRGYRRSDERIREDVCEALKAHPDVDASDFDVEVSGGAVTLKGEVASRAEKRCAEDCVEGLSGVHDVHNQLRVRSTSEHGDDGERRSANGPQSSKSGGQTPSPQKPASSTSQPQQATSR